MTTTPQRSFEGSTKESLAYGFTMFGAAVLVTIGLFQCVAGLAAIVDDELFVATPNYTFAFDLTAWGWTYLAIGAICIAVGVALFMRQAWAQVAGIVLAVLSALSNFMFLPYYPGWSLIIIAIDIVLIWALTTQFRSR